jgi:hypothetical protein
MTRTITPGLAIAICGMGWTLDDLVQGLDNFLAQAREAAGRGTSLVRFLSQFGAAQAATPLGTEPFR